MISDDLENFSIWLALSILTKGIHVAGLKSKKYLIVWGKVWYTAELLSIKLLFYAFGWFYSSSRKGSSDGHVECGELLIQVLPILICQSVTVMKEQVCLSVCLSSSQSVSLSIIDKLTINIRSQCLTSWILSTCRWVLSYLPWQIQWRQLQTLQLAQGANRS